MSDFEPQETLVTVTIDVKVIIKSQRALDRVNEYAGQGDYKDSEEAIKWLARNSVVLGVDQANRIDGYADLESDELVMYADPWSADMEIYR